MIGLYSKNGQKSRSKLDTKANTRLWCLSKH